MRHARAIFTLLSFRDDENYPDTREIRFPMNEFCRRYAKSTGGRYMRDIKNIVSVVRDTGPRGSDALMWAVTEP